MKIPCLQRTWGKFLYYAHLGKLLGNKRMFVIYNSSSIVAFGYSTL